MKNIYDLLNQVDYALKFQDDFNLQSMFKALEVEFEAGEGNFLEGLVYFLDVCSKFQKVKILTFVNLKTYLMSEELHEFYKEAFYRKYSCCYWRIILLMSLQKKL